MFRMIVLAIVILWQCSFASDLAVVSAIPQGQLNDINDAGQILITFNQPMVPLQQSAQPANVSFSLVPNVPGKLQWMGSRSLVFTPADTLAYATQYTIRLEEGLESLEGTRLSEPFTTSFTTPIPRILNTLPTDGDRGIDLDALIYVMFNQPVDKNTIKPFITLEKGNSDSPLLFNLFKPSQKEVPNHWLYQADTTEILVIKPKTLQPSQRYRLQILKGAPAAQGELGLAETHTLSFETFGALSVIEVKGRTKKETGLADPAGGISFEFNNRVAPSELVQHLKIDPPVQTPDYYANYHWGEQRIHLSISMQADTVYKVILDSALTDIHGNSLKKSKMFTLRTGHYASQVMMTTGPGILESKGHHNFPVEFVNIDTVNLQMGTIAVDQLIPLLNRKEGLFSPRTALPDSLFMIDRIWQIKGKKNTRLINPIDLDWLLAGRKSAVVLAEIGHEKDHGPIYHRALIQVTDLGISAKFSAMNNLVWVTRLSDAGPVANANVEIRNDQNDILWQGETDAQGMVETPGWKKLGIEPKNAWQRPRQWILVKHNEQVGYTASDWGTGIYPYRFGIDYEWNPKPEIMMGTIFSDRGLYRAGETVRLKGILREKRYDHLEIPAGKKLRLSIRDPRGEIVETLPVQVNEFGSFHTELQLKSNASLGYYWVQAETLVTDSDPDRWTDVMGGNFQVQAFRTADFKVRIETRAPAYVMGDSVSFSINGSFLFGAPMRQQPVRYTCFLERGAFAPKSFKDYSFGPLEWGPFEPAEMGRKEIAQGNGKLDSNGDFGKQIVPDVPQITFPSELLISADVTGPSRQHLGATKHVDIHPAAFYIGLAQNTHFVPIGESLEYEIIALDLEEKIDTTRNVNVRIVRREWHSVHKAGVGGRYEWISKPVDVTVDSFIVSTTQELYKQFIPEKPGLYFIQASGHDENQRKTVSEIYFYASGRGYVAWERGDDDFIELVADKQEYSIGDTARIMIKSPYETTRALVTLEREGILYRETMNLEGSAPTITIPIRQNYLPNIFVGVILLQGRTAFNQFSDQGRDIGKPQFKIGYLNLPVRSDRKQLDVQVKASQNSFRPGEKVTIDVQVKDYQKVGKKAELTIAVADEGVLNLIGYDLPDPFNVFYGMRSLSVQTSETRLHVIEQRNYGEKGENRGGSGSAGSLVGKDLRERFKSLAFWEPQIVTDDRGRVSLSFDLPDNLTTWRVMVVAQTMDACFGQGSTDFQVNKPLLIQPNMPRFVRLGDRFQAGAVIHNESGSAGTITLEAKSDDLEINGNLETIFDLDQGESRLVLFPFEVIHPRKSQVEFFARMGSYSDAVRISVPFHSASRPETVALAHHADSTAQEKVAVPENLADHPSLLELEISPGLLGQMQGPLDYLFHYPYECLEQQLSRIMPVVVAEPLLGTFEHETDSLKNFAQSVLDQIVKFQNFSGGLGLWRSSERASPFVSSYAGLVLTKAKKQGFDVENALLENLLRYLHNWLDGSNHEESAFYTQAERHTTEALILYVFALNQQPDAGYVERLFERRSSIPLIAQAFLLKTLHIMNFQPAWKEQLTLELFNKIRLSPRQAYFQDVSSIDMPFIYPSSTRATAIILQALLETDAEIDYSHQIVNWLLDQRKGKHWSNTQENAFVLYALSDYLQKTESADPDMIAEIMINETSVKEKTLTRRDQHLKHQLDLLPYSGDTLDVRFSRQGKGSIYYSMVMTYEQQDQDHAIEQGLTVLKEMTVANGEKADSLRVGTLYKIRLRVILSKQRQYIVVEDPLPAGFEPVNLQLASAGESRYLADQTKPWAGFSHVEMQNDRVLLFADVLDPGVHEFEYLVRATFNGIFALPSTLAQEMYHPENFARTNEKNIKIF
ncbi:hypothetical protein GF406_03850 [candidate division KSB1 bacterium]|nr:hypothetical protein [candidate division KSB1 bacterium]